MPRVFLLNLLSLVCLPLILLTNDRAATADCRVTVKGEQILLNGQPIKLIGLRCSNALISDNTTDDLIDALDGYKAYGLNTVSVFVMGSRFGNVKGYHPDGSMNSVHRDRLEKILTATQSREMVVIVGCLYWGTSEAKTELAKWTADDASRAVAGTAKWLGDKGFEHVILDPDNEGMAQREMPWHPNVLIKAAKDANPSLVVANNTAKKTSDEDLNMHTAKKEAGKPWFDSESSAKRTPLSAYWYQFSREKHDADATYHNYSRIGRYTAEMKEYTFNRTKELMEKEGGMLLASTWLQCAPTADVGGPFTQPGGDSNLGSNDNLTDPWNQDIDKLHSDAGIRWWLTHVKKKYGPWNGATPSNNVLIEENGELCIEAENFTHQNVSTYALYSNEHKWHVRDDKRGFAGKGFVQILPDEWPERGKGPMSPRGPEGACLHYPVRITTPGKYWVFVRGYAIGGESNGIHVGVDNVLAAKEPGASNIAGFRPIKKWVWESVRKPAYPGKAMLELTAGDHVINVWNRDDAFRLDKVVLRLKNVKPLGEGPSESKRDE